MRRLGLVLPLVDEALDRGGQVSLLLLDDGADPTDGRRTARGLPLAVEVHRLAAGWPQGIDDSLRWTDQVCTAIAAEHLPALAESSAARTFALMLVLPFRWWNQTWHVATGPAWLVWCLWPMAA